MARRLRTITGRPTLYTEALGALICERMIEPASLRQVCAGQDMPHFATVMRWLARGEAGEPPFAAFREQYAIARQMQADVLVDEILEIADDARNDWMAKPGRGDAAPGWAENGEALRRSAMRISARQWLAAMLRPKRYGTKLELDGDVGLTVRIKRFGAAGSE